MYMSLANYSEVLMFQRTSVTLGSLINEKTKIYFKISGNTAVRTVASIHQKPDNFFVKNEILSKMKFFVKNEIAITDYCFFTCIKCVLLIQQTCNFTTMSL